MLSGEANDATPRPSSWRGTRCKATIARLPLAKDADDFTFEGTPVNRDLVRDLAGGGFLTQQRNVV